MEAVISLGSNFGDRKANLHTGLEHLKRAGFSIRHVSPTVESPAQLPPNSPSEWNRPFLNLVVIGDSSKELETFFQETKSIEFEIGKPGDSKWSPRKLDIDIVSWGRKTIKPDLGNNSVPEIYMRPYVLSPLLHLSPGWPVSLDREISALGLSSSRAVEFHIPTWMGIVNVTPDSFSDGGLYKNLEDVQAAVEHMIESGVNIIDIGAESTRPNAVALSDDEEWQRLEPVLKMVGEICAHSILPPSISVDTYHPLNAQRALEHGADIINDVTGLRDELMLAIARDSGKTFIAMHSVTVPVDPDISIDPKDDACNVFEKWIIDRRELWESKGLDLDNIVIDPGIGFGKSSLQSLELMRSVRRLRRYGHRVLIGHSRKRFLKSFSNFGSADLDLETIGASLNLCAQSVDILRVHNVEGHIRAFLSWAHLLNNKDGKSG